MKISSQKFYLLTVFVFAVLLSSCSVIFKKTEKMDIAPEPQTQTPEKLPLIESEKVKNIIFLIGDGTGLAQIASGQLAHAGPDGWLAMQTMPVTGIVKVHSSDNLITDSAAGATAFACGKKTDNGVIAQLPDGRNCKTLMEFAIEAGMSTALVATSSITHATPASFASHVPSRGQENVIAEQLVESGVDVMLGGGLEFFARQGQAGSVREDNRDLIEELIEAGYTVTTNRDELSAASADKLVGLYAADGLTRAESEPTLPEMTEKALQIISEDEDGFFMMIEGSQIDWAGHDNNVEYALREIKDFDQTIQKVLEFAQEDGETLVVVTADHETGGMTLQKSQSGNTQMKILWTSRSHTGIPVPLMAYGPGAIEFTGWWDNTDIGKKMAKMLNFEPFPSIN